MTPNLPFSRKTWYFLLLAAAAASMLNGFAVLAGQDFSFLELLAFGATGLAVLFLAAERSNPMRLRQAYFGVFVILLLGYIFGAPLGYVFSALVWPLRLVTESRRGGRVRERRGRGGVAEVGRRVLLLATLAGLNASFFTNLFWLLTAIARGAGALALYRAGEPDHPAEG